MSEEKKIRIRQIELRLHSHATESLPKIQDALKSYLPDELDAKNYSISNMAGSYGNPIRGIEVKITKQKFISDFLENLGQTMPSTDKTQLIKELDQRVDEKYNFYFRIAKQGLMLGKTVLANATKDIIQIIISFHNLNPKSQLTIDDIRNYLISGGFFQPS